MTPKEIGLAIAKANRHPAPEDYAIAFERAANGQDPYPPEAEAEPEAPAVEEPEVPADPQPL